MTLDELKVAVDRAADPRQPLGWPEVKALRTLSRMLERGRIIYKPSGGYALVLPLIEESEK